MARTDRAPRAKYTGPTISAAGLDSNDLRDLSRYVIGRTTITTMTKVPDPSRPGRFVRDYQSPPTPLGCAAGELVVDLPMSAQSFVNLGGQSLMWLEERQRYEADQPEVVSATDFWLAWKRGS